jgi:hypothetical protein
MKSKTRTTPTPTPPVTPIALLSALIGSSRGSLCIPELLHLADAELPALLAAPHPSEAAHTAVQRINFAVWGDTYYQGSTYMESLDGPNTADSSTPQCIREWDTQAGFALGLTFGLRLAGVTR